MIIYHGTMPLPNFHGEQGGTEPLRTKFSAKSESVNSLVRVAIDEFLGSSSLRVRNLPREARIVFTVLGRQEESGTAQDYSELGWASLQLFDSDL